MWNKTQFVSFAKNKKVLIGSASTVSFVIGATTGFFYAKNKLAENFAATLDLEVQEAKNFYASINQTELKQDKSPSELVKELHPEEKYEKDVEVAQAIKTKHNYSNDFKPKNPEDKTSDEIEAEKSMEVAIELDTPDETVEVHVETKNIFEGREPIEDDFDLETEMEARTSESPYVITHDEYFNATEDYPQETLTYFDGDGVLMDDEDSIVDAIEATVGYNNLERFGAGSKDANIVYIRNETMMVDMEVHKSTGSYAEEVLGVPKAVLEHSDKPRIRKFRGTDE